MQITWAITAPEHRYQNFISINQSIKREHFKNETHNICPSKNDSSY